VDGIFSNLVILGVIRNQIPARFRMIVRRMVIIGVAGNRARFVAQGICFTTSGKQLWPVFVGLIITRLASVDGVAA